MKTRFFCFVVFIWVPLVAAGSNLLLDAFGEQLLAAAPFYQLTLLYTFLMLMFLPFLLRAFALRKRRRAP